MIRIEVQDEFGNWHFFTRVANVPTSIKQALENSLKSQLAKKSGRARALDEKTGQIIDFLNN